MPPTETSVEPLNEKINGDGICADNLGASSEAVSRMESITTNSPRSAYAVRSLFWLANHFIAQSEYERAGAYLADLIERYPDDRLASDAQQLKRRLDESIRPTRN